MIDFKWILLVHILVTIVVFLIAQKRHNWLQAMTETLFVFFLPGFGLIILLVFRLADKGLHLSREKQPADDAVKDSFFLDTMHCDEDVVPLRDTFLLDDIQKKRQFFTEAIKQNVIENQEILQMAMHDEDRETAYYVVSMMTSKMEDLETQLFTLEGELIGEDKEHLDGLREYAGLLKGYLSHERFIDHVTFRQKQGVYLGIMDRLVSLFPQEKQYYKEQYEQLLQMREYPVAEELCGQFQRQFPDDEDAFLMYIAVYQKMHDMEKLQQKIREMKASPIALSKKALNVIRYWDEGSRNE